MISVVIPVHNVERYLERCIQSVLAQTLAPDEIVFVNDGSTDGSQGILRRYADRPNVRIVNQRNGGVSNARNRGIDIARGDFLYFMDSDACIHPQTLELAYRAILESNADFVVIDFTKIAADAPVPKIPVYPELQMTYWRQPMAGFMRCDRANPDIWRFLHRRSAIGDLRFQEGLLYEDLHFTYLFLRHASSGGHLPLPLYFYVQTPGSLLRHPVGQKDLNFYDWIMRHLTADAQGDAQAVRLYKTLLFPHLVKMMRKRIERLGDNPSRPSVTKTYYQLLRSQMKDRIISLRGGSLRDKLRLLHAWLAGRRAVITPRRLTATFGSPMAMVGVLWI